MESNCEGIAQVETGSRLVDISTWTEKLFELGPDVPGVNPEDIFGKGGNEIRVQNLKHLCKSELEERNDRMMGYCSSCFTKLGYNQITLLARGAAVPRALQMMVATEIHLKQNQKSYNFNLKGKMVGPIKFKQECRLGFSAPNPQHVPKSQVVLQYMGFNNSFFKGCGSSIMQRFDRLCSFKEMKLGARYSLRPGATLTLKLVHGDC